MTTQAVTAKWALPRIGVDLVPGLLLSASVAWAAMQLGGIGWFAAHGLSALTVAIVLGMLAGNTFYPSLADRAGAGVTFSKQTLLRAGVILYGLRLTLGDVGKVGLHGLLIDALVLASTFGLATIVGTRLLRLDRDSSILIGAGSAICGAAAVMATQPVVRARSEQVAMAVASVVLFGTVAVFLYPALHAANADALLIKGGAAGFGVYAGSTIHEVAQVVAAAGMVGADAADAAVIAKMVRVMMLAPFLLALSAWGARSRPATSGQRRPRIAIPWFAFGFVALAGLRSLGVLPAAALAVAGNVDLALLAVAMAALGLTTRLSAMKAAGLAPLGLGAALAAWLVAGGAAINAGVAALAG